MNTRSALWCGAVCAVAILFVSGCGKPAPRAGEATPSPEPTPIPLSEEQQTALTELATGIDAQLGRRYEDALVHFEKAQSLDPALRGVTYQRAVTLMNLGREGDSEAEAYKSVAAGEQVAQAYNLIGTMAARRQDFPVALWAFGKAQEAEPADPMAFYNASEALRNEGRTTEAIEQLRAAIQRNPGEPLFAMKLRLARIEAGEGKFLIPEVSEQLKIDPPAGDWLLTAGAISLSNGRYEEAAGVLARAKDAMQPILFVGILREDPFFKKFADRPEVRAFYDATISVNPAPAPSPSAP